jgi:hypothetical protein
LVEGLAKGIGLRADRAAQLSMLLEGIDRRMPIRTWRPVSMAA